MSLMHLPMSILFSDFFFSEERQKSEFGRGSRGPREGKNMRLHTFEEVYLTHEAIFSQGREKPPSDCTS